MPTLLPLLFSFASVAQHSNYHGPSPWWFALFVVISCAFGDTVDYFTGVFSERIMDKWHWVKRHIKDEDIKKGTQIFEKNGPLAIMMMSCVPVLHSAVTLSAGVLKYPFTKFISINTSVNVVLVLSCMLLSHICGQIPIIKNHLILFSFMMMFILFGTGFFLKKKLSK